MQFYLVTLGSVCFVLSVAIMEVVVSVLLILGRVCLVLCIV